MRVVGRPKGVASSHHRSTHFFSQFVLVLSAIITLYPFIWVVLGSLKNNTEIFTNSFGFPHVWRFANYYHAWVDGHVGLYFVNSLIVSGSSVFGLVFASAMASYVLARFKFRFNFLVYTTFLVGLMVPWAANLLPVFITLRNVSLLNTRIGLVLPYIAFGLPFGIFVITGFMKSIPSELEEAAVIDGCGYAKIFALIILPLSVSALVTVATLTFFDIWNEYLFALVFLNDPTKFTMALGLTALRAAKVTYYGYIMAGIVLSIVPVMTVFLILQNHVVKGVTAGAIKA